MRVRSVLGLLLLASSCGPSLRMVHESTVYFERCHAAELDPRVPLSGRAECWQRWLDHYTEAQVQTRVLYARERLVHLASGEIDDPLPTEETAAAETAAFVPAQGASASSPSPVFGPRPDLGGTIPGATPTERPVPLLPRNTGHSVCQPVCRPAWDACSGRCDVSDRGCVSACQNQYASCMAGCLG